MKILLIGGGGQLGQTLINSAPQAIGNHSIELISIYKKDLDLLDLSSCKKIVQELKPDFLINAAAYTNVDAAESDYSNVFTVNASAPKAFAEAILKTRGKLIQFSTDYVFDGKSSRPYKLFDKKNPINIYGESKSKGEDYILDILSPSSQCFILRTSWLISLYGNNFLLKMLKLLNEKDIIKVVTDQISSPTTTTTLANSCWSLINRICLGDTPTQILHFTSFGLGSWYDLAQSIAEYGREFGILTKPAKVIPINTTEYALPAKRPSFSVLDLSESKQYLDIPVIYWRDSVKNLLKLLGH
ncbi:dTDP-4-dehydrorhamnose reductase [Prochlorococcus marinus]|uniref:dTDP-4-dehydrorhamnose reductase n=1 Tax=Prochlorococcus marinus TaxID=1219 RepID=UPI001C598078|nr:dTDP-4-dehydrorhamnose reductase [Prochlorococcus marinus]MBW3042882.1 dTDP-4-dehydrorhamnose reductase [Prochlorococcus marinus str. XMU1408]